MRRECRERFPRHRGISDPDMRQGTCVTHVPWCMSGSLTSGFLWSRWRGKRSRHSRYTRKPQFYVSGKRPIQNRNVQFFVLNALLWDMRQVHCRICENGLLLYKYTWRCPLIQSYGLLKWYPPPPPPSTTDQYLIFAPCLSVSIVYFACHCYHKC